MASNIDITKPSAGNALTADVRNNFATAKSEIEALQALPVIPSILVGNAAKVITVNLTETGYTLSTIPSSQSVAAQQTQTATATAASINWISGDTLIVSPAIVADLVIPTPTNPAAGHIYTFIITQDATGGRIVTFPDGTTWTGGYPNEKRRFSFYYDGTDYT